MQTNITLERTVVAVAADESVHLLVELAAPPAPSTAARPAIDVVAVLDRSGSMAGAPLASVKEATSLLARLLGPRDRLGLVVFDDEADMLLPLSHHDPIRVAGKLSRVDDGGSTNLSGGWLKAFEMLSESGRADAIRRIVLLTDGMANAGITDAAALTGVAASSRVQGVTTSMIGFGEQYDERLLAAMSDAGGGNDYWCAGPDRVTKVFADEFAGLAAVVAQNISVEFRLRDVVRRCGVLGEYPIIHVDGGIQLALGDAMGGERRRVVAQFDLAAQPALGTTHVADVVIRWVSAIGDVELHNVIVPVTIEVGTPADADDAQVDPGVVEQVNLLHVARARREADSAVRVGDFAAASRILADAVPVLERTTAPPSVVAELVDDAARLERHDWHERDHRRSFSTVRESERGRQRRYDESA